MLEYKPNKWRDNMDFLRSILKWIILGILFIIIIVLIVKFANRTDNKKNTTNEPPVNITDRAQEELIEEPIAENAQTNESQTVDSPDTASNSFPHVLIGLSFLTIAGRYIYKNRNTKENS